MNEAAERSDDAYARKVGYYSKREWNRIADWLQFHQGYSDAEVEVILRSKHMRWAADNAKKSGFGTLADFKVYYGTVYASGASVVDYITDMLIEEQERREGEYEESDYMSGVEHREED